MKRPMATTSNKPTQLTTPRMASSPQKENQSSGIAAIPPEPGSHGSDVGTLRFRFLIRAARACPEPCPEPCPERSRGRSRGISKRSPNAGRLTQVSGTLHYCPPRSGTGRGRGSD